MNHLSVKYDYLDTQFTYQKFIFYHTVDGRNPAPPWMVETL